MKLFSLLVILIFSYYYSIAQNELSLHKEFGIATQSFFANRDHNQSELHIQPYSKNSVGINYNYFKKNKFKNFGINCRLNFNSHQLQQKLYDLRIYSSEYYHEDQKRFSESLDEINTQLRSLQFNIGIFKRFYSKNEFINFDLGLNLNYNLFFKQKIIKESNHPKHWIDLTYRLDIRPKSNFTYTTYFKTNIVIHNNLSMSFGLNFGPSLKFDYYHKVNLTYNFNGGSDVKKSEYQFGEENHPLTKRYNYIGIDFGLKYCF